jgi:hypothetical protein
VQRRLGVSEEEGRGGEARRRRWLGEERRRRGEERMRLEVEGITDYGAQEWIGSI